MNETPAQTNPCIPTGWTVLDVGAGEIIVTAPNGNPGGMTLTGKERPLAQRLLYSLARDMLDSTKSQHQGADGGQGAGLTLAHVPNSWSADMPTVPGLYWNKSFESDFVPTQVFVFERGGVLMSVSHIGVGNLDALHDGLTQPQWARIVIPVHTEAVGPDKLLQAFKESAQGTHELTMDKHGGFMSSTTQMAFDSFIEGATWLSRLQ